MFFKKIEGATEDSEFQWEVTFDFTSPDGKTTPVVAQLTTSDFILATHAIEFGKRMARTEILNSLNLVPTLQPVIQSEVAYQISQMKAEAPTKKKGSVPTKKVLVSAETGEVINPLG